MISHVLDLLMRVFIAVMLFAVFFLIVVIGNEMFASRTNNLEPVHVGTKPKSTSTSLFKFERKKKL